MPENALSENLASLSGILLDPVDMSLADQTNALGLIQLPTRQKGHSTDYMLVSQTSRGGIESLPLSASKS